MGNPNIYLIYKTKINMNVLPISALSLDCPLDLLLCVCLCIAVRQTAEN